MLLSILFIIFAYLLGSLSSAIIVCKLMGLPDPRSQGSGNPGATNVLRFGGKKLAIIVLSGDILKGILPVLLAKLAGISTMALGWVALAAFIGHLYPIFFGFRGGKGVATAFGALLILCWPLALSVLATWLIVAVLFRYSSLAALIATTATPILAWWLIPVGEYIPVLLMSLFLIARHYDNIRRLLAGKEVKIGAKK